MKRILLLHWNQTEALERAGRLRAAGYEVRVLWTIASRALAPLRENPPEGIVIDLARLPTQGRNVAVYLRRLKPTRHVPLVFVGGAPEKVEAIRHKLPDAEYVEWRGIRGTLRKALAKAPAAKPVVPAATMPDYSGTPLPKKLGIRAGETVALLGGPDGFARQLDPLPEDVRLLRKPAGAQRILLFAKSFAEFERAFARAVEALPDKGALWICWPKKSSGIPSDVNQIVARDYGLERGLVDYKICAIDATWSGLCFAWRGGRRPGAYAGSTTS